MAQEKAFNKWHYYCQQRGLYCRPGATATGTCGSLCIVHMAMPMVRSSAKFKLIKSFSYELVHPRKNTCQVANLVRVCVLETVNSVEGALC